MAVTIGNQRPRVAYTPDYLYTDGADALELAANYGIVGDAWQADIVRAWLAINTSGSLLSGRCGLSVARQNGKNAILEMIELFKMVIQGRAILHTAHEVKTARKAFFRLASFFENEREYPELAKLVKDIRRANGQEAIYLTNGGQCEFVARSRSSARGFTVDDLVMDEAQELTDEQHQALTPTISASPSGDPQQIFIGTPPGPNAPGEVFPRMREEALGLSARRLSWFEWSIPETVRAEKALRQWRTLAYDTNPALGIRLNIKTIEDEKNGMSADGFLRERLGQWPLKLSGSPRIKETVWAVLESDEIPEGRLVVGVKFSADGTYAALAAAVRPHEAGVPIHVDGIRLASTAEGVTWIVDYLKRLGHRLSQIVVDGKAWTPVLVDALEEAEFPLGNGVNRETTRFLRIASVPNIIEAHAMFLDAIQDEALTHGPSPLLAEQVGNATTRKIGTAGGWGWQSLTDTGNTTLLDAVTFAYWSAKTVTRNSQAKQRTVMLK